MSNLLKINNSLVRVMKTIDPTETWIIRVIGTNNKGETKNFNVSFKSNEKRYSLIQFKGGAVPIGDDKEYKFSGDLYYDKDQVYDLNAGWINKTYRTIILDEPATGDFLTWLQANAVKQ